MNKYYLVNKNWPVDFRKNKYNENMFKRYKKLKAYQKRKGVTYRDDNALEWATLNYDYIRNHSK